MTGSRLQRLVRRFRHVVRRIDRACCWAIGLSFLLIPFVSSKPR